MSIKSFYILLSIMTLNNIIAETPLPENGNKCYSCLNRWKGISTVIGYALWPLEVVETLYRRITYFIDDINDRNKVKKINKEKEIMVKNYYCSFDKFYNCIENINKLDKSLENIVGQKKAIEIIKKSVISIIQKYYEHDFLKEKKKNELEKKVAELEKDLKNKKLKSKQIKKEIEKFRNQYLYENKKYLQNGPGCTFMYFVGPAGTGKTETALSLVCSVASNSKPAYIIDAATLLSNDGKLSTLIEPINIGTKKNKQLIRSDLDTYIRTSGRGVIIFNEIDKILVNRELAANLNETLRTLKDNNYYISQGEKVDVSGFIFIFTSNEKINKSKNDDTSSMTDVYFDQSLRTRFRIIEFESFEKDEYEELIRRYLNDVHKSFNEMYEKYKIKINFEKDIENYCAEYIVSNNELKNRGARSIYDVLGDDLKSKLFITMENLKNKKLQNSTIYVSFDENNNEFVVNTENFIEHKQKEVINNNKTKITKYTIVIIIIITSIIALFVGIKKNRKNGI